MFLVIPTSNSPYSVQRTDIEGREYTLSFDFSSRESVWYLSVADSDGADIVVGLKLVIGIPLTSRVTDTRIFPGLLFVYTKTQDDSPPGLDDLLPGARCELTYVTIDEVT